MPSVNRRDFRLPLLAMVVVIGVPLGGGGCNRGIEEAVEIDSTAPSISSVLLEGQAVTSDEPANVPTSPTLQVTFSKPMNTESVTAAFSFEEESDEGSTLKLATTASATWNDDNTVVTINPASALSHNTRHCLRLSTDANDASGNRLAENYEACFTTKCASSTDFDEADDLDCFTLYKVLQGPGGITEESGLGSFLDALTVSGGTLTMDHKATDISIEGAGVVFLAKQLAAGTEDFSVELLVTGGMPSNPNESVALAVSLNTDISDLGFIQYHFPSVQEGRLFDAESSINGAQNALGTQPLTGVDNVFLRLARSGTTLTYAYKTSAGADYTTLVTENRSTAGDSLGDPSATLLVGILTWTENTLGTFAPAISSFQFLSGGAENQE